MSILIGYVGPRTFDDLSFDDKSIATLHVHKSKVEWAAGEPLYLGDPEMTVAAELRTLARSLWLKLVASTPGRTPTSEDVERQHPEAAAIVRTILAAGISKVEKVPDDKKRKALQMMTHWDHTNESVKFLEELMGQQVYVYTNS